MNLQRFLDWLEKHFVILWVAGAIFGVAFLILMGWLAIELIFLIARQ